MRKDEKLDHPIRALIYLRVSSSKQTREGDGSDSQERRCRNYAQERGYPVDEVFSDTISGAKLKREAMQQLEEHVRVHKGCRFVVIIDDISRFARDMEVHLKLRKVLSSLGVELESPSFKFGKDPDSKFFEHLFVGVAAHFRDKNGEQTNNRRRSRVQNGYYPFKAPLGYEHAIVAGHHGKLLVLDEPIASVIGEMLVSYADGRLGMVAEARRFLNGHPVFVKAKRTFTQQKVHDILKHPIYSGHISSEKFGVGFIRGHHEALIDLETYLKIQDRLAGKAYAPARKDIRRGSGILNKGVEWIVRATSA